MLSVSAANTTTEVNLFFMVNIVKLSIMEYLWRCRKIVLFTQKNKQKKIKSRVSPRACNSTLSFRYANNPRRRSPHSPRFLRPWVRCCLRISWCRTTRMAYNRTFWWSRRTKIDTKPDTWWQAHVLKTKRIPACCPPTQAPNSYIFLACRAASTF